MDIKGKNILFLGPKFHDYEVMIMEQLGVLGAQVDFFPERSYGLDFNIYNNFFPAHLERRQAKHYHKILKEVNGKHYDYLFVVRGFMLPISFLEMFRELNPEAKTIMYQWDSQRTNPFRHLISHFDIVKTFDFKDSDELGIPYVPLFYTKDVEEYQIRKKIAEYDFFFMGFFFDERYNAILKFREYCEKKGFKLKPFLYMPTTTRVKYFFKGKKLDKSIVSFKHMDRKSYLDILSKSRVMVDVSNPKQTGLAMRVIESLACNTKVVTNNIYFEKDESVKKSGMVHLFDLDNIDVDKYFVNENSNLEKKPVLSLEQWLVNVFCN